MKGIEKILIPGKGGLVYCAPGLILHYITAHGYKPPAAFVDAVMAISNVTHFNGHVYDIQICRYAKGLPLYTYEELVRIGFIEDGDPEPWWVYPEMCTISEVLELKTTSAAVGAAPTRYELDQLEKQRARQLWEAVSVGSKTGKSLACGERVSPESIAEAIDKLKATSRTLPEHRSTAIILGRIYRYANNSQPVGLHAAISVLSETIAALRQSGGSTKDEADLFYNRACYYWLLSKLNQDNPEGYLTKCIDDLNESIFLHPDEETKTLRRRYLDNIKVEPFPEIEV